jgi:hypothetical protein
MMDEAGEEFRRKNIRAPIKGEFLYDYQDYLLKGALANISEGGVCVGNLAKIPEVKFISAMFALPLYPDLSHLDQRHLSMQDVEQVEKKVVKATIKIVRSFSGEDRLDGIFLREVGCQFVDLNFEDKNLVIEYVYTFSKNITFLLSLFESINKTNDIRLIENLRWCAGFLGYNASVELTKLRQKILHDYQSIKSL